MLTIQPFRRLNPTDMGMDQYLLMPFLGGWTSIYQLFWCSPGVQGFDTLPYDIPIYPRHIQTLNVPAQLVFFVDTVMDSLALNETLVPTLDRGLNRQLVWFREGFRCTQQSMLQAASMTAKHQWIQFDSYRTKYWIYTVHWVRFESVYMYIYIIIYIQIIQVAQE